MLLDLVSASMPLHTSSAISATGATTLVSAPGAGKQIAVQAVRVWGMTNTTGQMQGAFFDGSAQRFWHVGISLGAALIDRDLQASPSLWNTNTALQYACTVSAASTPGLFVEVVYQIVSKG